MTDQNRETNTIDKEMTLEDYLNPDKIFKNPQISIGAYEV